MNIKNRKKKPYSNKLFNELFLFALLINSENEAYLYVLNRKLKKSRRTLYRYTEDLHKNGLTPEISIHKVGKYSYFKIEDIPGNFGDDEIKDCFTDYIESNINIIGKSEEHKSKIYRLSLLIITNIDNFYNICNFEDEPKEFDHLKETEDGDYAFEYFDSCDYLYKNLSARTKQREIKLAKDIISYLF